MIFLLSHYLSLHLTSPVLQTSGLEAAGCRPAVLERGLSVMAGLGCANSKQVR